MAHATPTHSSVISTSSPSEGSRGGSSDHASLSLCLAFHCTLHPRRTAEARAGVSEPHIQILMLNSLPATHPSQTRQKYTLTITLRSTGWLFISPRRLALIPHKDIVTKKATEHTSASPLHRTPSETARSAESGLPL